MNELQSTKRISYEAMRPSNSEYTVTLLREALRVGIIDEVKESALRAKFLTDSLL